MCTGLVTRISRGQSANTAAPDGACVWEQHAEEKTWIWERTAETAQFVVTLLANINYSDKIKEDEMDRACSTDDVQLSCENMQGKIIL
jgi:hypothetical protein